jgi:drug/metabolite transporter (DMT)-like permease
MGAKGRQHARRILVTLALGISCGALADNAIGDDLLDLGGSWPTVLWLVGAVAGAALTWTTTSEDTPLPSRTSALGTLAVVVLAIACIVLLREPIAYYASAVILLAGGTVLFALTRPRRHHASD